MTAKQHRRQRAGVPIGIKAAIGVLAAVVLAVPALWMRPAAFPRLELAGYRISEEEYRQVMYQARNDVLSDHAAVGHSLTDWTAETPLGDPVRLTVDRAIEILCETYAVSSLAVERGYLADGSYDAMKKDMEDINRQRKEALDSGAVITGFPSFTAEDYRSYRESSIRLQFCNDPANPEYQVTEEEILRRYEADRDDLYRKPDDLELRVLLTDAAPGEIDTLAQTFEKARETGDLAAALEKFPQLLPYYLEISVNSGTYGIYARSHADVLTWSADLQTGDISPVIRQADRLCLIQCLGRTVHQYVPLEDVESVVIQSIRERRYDDLVTARAEATEIRGDLDALYRFTAEQLH